MIRYILIVWMTMLAAWGQPAMGQASGDGDSKPPYPGVPFLVEVTSVENGTVIFESEGMTDRKEVYSGEKVTVTAKPNDGYVVNTITVTTKKGETIVYKKIGSDDPLTKKLTFTMPASPVTITAEFVPGDIELSPSTKEILCLFGNEVTFDVSSLVKNMEYLINPTFALVKTDPALPFEAAIDGKGKLTCAPNAVGSHNIKVQISAEFVESVTVTITVKVDKAKLPEGVAGVEPDNTKTECGWNSKTILHAPVGYEIALVEEGVNPLNFDWGENIEVTKSGDYDQKYMLRDKKDHTIYVDDPRFVHIHLDCSAPSIKMEGDHSNIYVTVTDGLSGIAKISYHLDSEETKEISVPADRESYSFYVEASYETDHTVWVSVVDRAGNSGFRQENFYLIEPTYYTVTLPEIPIGATTNPAAGEHSVEEGYDFVFSILLEDDYNQSVPVVTIGMGEPLTPRKSDGKYVIPSVSRDLSVSISGIVKNPDPVSNAVITSGTKLKVQEHTLCLQVDHPATLYVATLAGRLWHTQSLSVGETFVEGLPSGVYIVSLSSGERWKVMVR